MKTYARIILYNFIIDKDAYRKFYKYNCDNYYKLKLILTKNNYVVLIVFAFALLLIMVLAHLTLGDNILENIRVPWWQLTLMSFIILLILFCYIMINFLKHTGLNKPMKFKGNYIKTNKNAAPFSIITDDIQTNNFEFVTPETVLLASKFNVRAYEGTRWMADVEEKYNRNLTHVQKNKYSMMFIRSDKNELIGYTHIMPITKTIWKKYMAGDIADNPFSSDQICAYPNDPNFTPYGILLFAIVDLSIPLDFEDQTQFPDNCLDIIEQAIAFHLKVVYEKHFPKNSHVPVLLQNIDPDFIKFFYPDKKIKNISKDGVPIIDFEIKLD